MAAAKPKIRNTQISNSGSPRASAAIFSSRWARREFTQNPARRPILQSNVGLVQPALALSRSQRYSGYTRLTTQPILRIRTPVFYLKTYFFHIFYQQRLSKTKKQHKKKTKCYEKTPKLKLLPYLRIFFKIFTGINLTLFYNQPDHLDLQLKKVALFGCLVRGPSKAACNNLLVTSPTGVVPTGFSDSQPNKRMSKHVLVPVYRF